MEAQGLSQAVNADAERFVYVQKALGKRDDLTKEIRSFLDDLFQYVKENALCTQAEDETYVRGLIFKYYVQESSAKYDLPSLYATGLKILRVLRSIPREYVK